MTTLRSTNPRDRARAGEAQERDENRLAIEEGQTEIHGAVLVEASRLQKRLARPG
jgi:hypothetical protein